MQIVPFESAKAPSFLRGEKLANNLFATASGSGFPVVSIKGKVFHIVRADGRELIEARDSEGNPTGDPAASIEVVILEAGPAGANRAKVYYDSGYTEGSDAKPTCYSNDGIAPSPNAQHAQASKCATCAKNVWGAKITEDGRKGKLCQDSKRLAVAPVGALGDPMMIRVPAASLKALDTYAKTLSSRGAPPQAVVTKIGFDYSVAHPQLTFKPVGFVSEETYHEAVEASTTTIVRQIVGLEETEFVRDEADVPAPKAAPKAAPAVEAPKPVAAPKAEAKPKAKPAPVVEDDDDLPVAPKATVKVEAAVVADDITDLDFDD